MPPTIAAETNADRTSGKIVFTGPPEFFKTLRARVDEHFAGGARRDDPRMQRKAAIIVVWFVGSYVLLLNASSGLSQLALCISFAVAACALGFNVFHDAVHGSFSANPRINAALGMISSAALGAGRKFWWFKHNVLHHTYTNIYQWDDDLETRGALRMSPEQPWLPKYRYQHLFFPFMYSLTTLEWMFVKDYVQYFTLKINPFQRIPELTKAEKIEFWFGKAFYMAVFVVLPFSVFPAWKVVVGLLLFHVTLSLGLAFIFNLAHAIERAEFPVPTAGATSLEIEEEWAAHQLRTTVNFATGNRALNWFAGGLNFQVEHHLFPQVSHTHYPALSAIVRETASECGLPYNHYATYRDAVLSHWRILRDLAQPPVIA